MFTGLIEGMGSITRVAPVGPDAQLTISPPWDIAQTVLGESVAINGACLTVTKLIGSGFTVDVSAESLSRTTLGKLRTGSRVNLERAMQLGDRLGGHLVTGHVDCMGVLERMETLGSSTRLYIAIGPEHLKFVVEKGSITVDGISLTVNRVDEAGFDLNIIPHTLDATSLKLAKEGVSVNIETDLIGKYVARLMNRDEDQSGTRSGLNADDLARMGF